MFYQSQKSILLLECLRNLIIQSIPAWDSSMTFVTSSKGPSSVEKTLNTKHTMFNIVLDTFQLLALISCINLSVLLPSASEDGISSLENVRSSR